MATASVMTKNAASVLVVSADAAVRARLRARLQRSAGKFTKQTGVRPPCC